MNYQNDNGSTKDIRDKLLSAGNASEVMVNDTDLTIGQHIQAIHELNTVYKTYFEVSKKVRTKEQFPDVF